MSDISKLALRRLYQEQGSSAGAHLDADLLTGFAEQGLKGSERELVLAHLAECADCREVVLMAGAAIQEKEIAQPVPLKVRKGFWSWGSLRWTAAAATAVVVLSAVWLDVHESEQRQVASYSDKAPAIVQQQEEAVSPSQPVNTQTDKSLSDASQHNLKIEAEHASERVQRDIDSKALKEPLKQKKEMALAPPPASKDLAQLAGGAVAGQPGKLDEQKIPRADQGLSARNEISRNGNMAAAPTGGPVLALPPNAPAAAPQVTMTYSRKAAGELAPATNVATGKAEAANAGARVLQHAPQSTDRLSEAASVVAPTEADQSETELAKAKVQGSTWRVTPDGRLQRSEDGGRKWILMLSEIGNFHAVAAAGPVVWAGADNGALWSSSNTGQTWRKMAPSFEGRSPRGNVLSIEVPSSLAVSFRTSAGETWDSADAGATWTVK